MSFTYFNLLQNSALTNINDNNNSRSSLQQVICTLSITLSHHHYRSAITCFSVSPVNENIPICLVMNDQSRLGIFFVRLFTNDCLTFWILCAMSDISEFHSWNKASLPTTSATILKAYYTISVGIVIAIVIVIIIMMTVSRLYNNTYVRVGMNQTYS